jgi:hypothetical protein
MQKKVRWYGLSGIAAVIAILWGIHAYADYESSPKPNLHPKYFVTISGNIEPNMPYPQTLVFRATYGAYHPDCRVWISRFEGVSGISGHTVYYPVQPDTKGDYRIDIPIDAYQPGKCDWKIAWVMSTSMAHLPPRKNWDDELRFGDVIDFGHFGSSDELPGLPGFFAATLYCGKGGADKCTGSELASGYSKVDVLRNRSYHFIQNIKNLRS